MVVSLGQPFQTHQPAGAMMGVEGVASAGSSSFRRSTASKEPVERRVIGDLQATEISALVVLHSTRTRRDNADHSG